MCKSFLFLFLFVPLLFMKVFWYEFLRRPANIMGERVFYVSEILFSLELVFSLTIVVE